MATRICETARLSTDAVSDRCSACEWESALMLAPGTYRDHACQAALTDEDRAALAAITACGTDCCLDPVSNSDSPRGADRG